MSLSRRTGLRRTALRAVSRARQAENRARRAVVAQIYDERPCCTVYLLSVYHPGIVPDTVTAGCTRWADDIHEPLTRGRGGSITDPGNMTAPCRPCHDVLTFTPESALGWAYQLGLLVHSGDGR